MGLLAEVNELFASVSLERAHVLLVLSFASGLWADRLTNCVLSVKKSHRKVGLFRHTFTLFFFHRTFSFWFHHVAFIFQSQQSSALRSDIFESLRNLAAKSVFFQGEIDLVDLFLKLQKLFSNVSFNRSWRIRSKRHMFIFILNWLPINPRQPWWIFDLLEIANTILRIRM